MKAIDLIKDIAVPSLDITNIAIYLDNVIPIIKDGLDIVDHLNSEFPFQIVPFNCCCLRSEFFIIKDKTEFFSVVKCTQKDDGNYKVIHNIGGFRRNKQFLGFFYIYDVDNSGFILPNSLKYQAYDSSLTFTDDPEIIRSGIHLTLPFFRTSLFSMSLMNCKNIEYVTEPKAALKELHNRKKHKKHPKTIYKILSIEGITKKLDEDGSIKTNGISKAFHLCRGHFRTYNEDKPLFGRIVGRFWTPMHVRGNKDQGQVIKDYKISTPNKTIKEQL